MSDAVPPDAAATDEATESPDEMSMEDALATQSDVQYGVLLLAAMDGLALPATPIMFEFNDDGSVSITATGADGAEYSSEFSGDDIDAALTDEPAAEEKPASDESAAA